MVEDLERVEEPAENVETPSETEKVEAPPEEEKPTLKTYTEEQFGKAQSSWDKQIALSKAEVKKAEAKVEQFKATQKHSQAYVQSLKDEMEKLASSVEDEDVRKTYTSRMASLEREMKLAQRESEAEQKLYDAEQTAWSVRMAQKAAEVVKETGIDMKELEGCQTEEEMDVKGLRFQINKEPEPKKEEKTPKFASGVSSGAGIPAQPSVEQLEKMSPEDYAKWAKDRYK